MGGPGFPAIHRGITLDSAQNAVVGSVNGRSAGAAV